MPTVRSQIDIAVPLRVPYFGEKGDAVSRSIPELQEYLKARYPEVETIHISYRNPRPEVTALLHDAWIVVAVFNPFTRKLAERLADDVYAWMKKHLKTFMKGHARKRARR